MAYSVLYPDIALLSTGTDVIWASKLLRNDIDLPIKALELIVEDRVLLRLCRVSIVGVELHCADSNCCADKVSAIDAIEVTVANKELYRLEREDILLVASIIVSMVFSMLAILPTVRTLAVAYSSNLEAVIALENVVLAVTLAII